MFTKIMAHSRRTSFFVAIFICFLLVIKKYTFVVIFTQNIVMFLLTTMVKI
jgi:hypothetical protein